MRRFALASMLVASLMLAMPASALAWGNGPPVNGRPGNGYGSHDWMLEQAIRNAGADGTWVVKRKALLASDNPDYTNVPAKFAAYWETGSCRGAPQMVSDMYHKVLVAYRAGDMATASTLLGEMSHFFTDTIQPFHTTGASRGTRPLHKQYELLVSRLQYAPDRRLSWITLRPTMPMTDVRAKTIAAAEYSRQFYPSLFRAFSRSRTVKTGTTNRITRLVQTRAVNDLADIIASIPQGTGEAADAAHVTLSLKSATVRPGQSVRGEVQCLDENGQPLLAVGVTFTWYLPSGKVTYLSFTDPEGRLVDYQSVGSSPVGTRGHVTARVTVNGVTTTLDEPFTVVR